MLFELKTSRRCIDVLFYPTLWSNNLNVFHSIALKVFILKGENLCFVGVRSELFYLAYRAFLTKLYVPKVEQCNALLKIQKTLLKNVKYIPKLFQRIWHQKAFLSTT